MTQEHKPLPPCHFCSKAALKLIAGYEKLHRVTSDCQPIAQGGQLAVCTQCAAVQKPINDHWQELVHTIYSRYQIYHQSGGLEQVIFDQNTGSANTRSAALLKKLLKQLPAPLPQQGRLLDVGCGNGAFLAAFAHLMPQWKLTGTELSDDHRARIEAIAGVESFFTGPAADVPGGFDLITLIHVLEHVPEPAAFLVGLAQKLNQPSAALTTSGAVEDRLATQATNLFIEVPDHTRNPFDLLIADHSAHFTQATLSSVIEKAGFSPLLVRNDIVPKELSAAACLVHTDNTHDKLTATPEEVAAAVGRVRQRVDWLQSIVALAQKVSADGPLGVFGTSIAGTWLGATLGDKVSFYVDEDTARHGRRFMNRPVMGVNNAPAGVPVLLALPEWLAKDIARRLAASGINWLLPPVMQG